MKSFSLSRALWAAQAGVQLASAISLNPSDPASILSASSTAAKDLFSYYQNANATNSTQVGLFPYPPIYWWESGAIWGGMLDYWAFTKDDTYQSMTMDALTAQLGPTYDFNMTDQIFDTGNDDQAFWGFNAMTAAEYAFPAPPAPAPSWEQIGANVFNDFVGRWSTSTCNGGLTWQIYTQNVNGLNYKNSISNGGFMQIAARLARYTNNQTYAEWAERVWEWEEGVGLIDSNFNVYDGTNDQQNCTSVNHIQWTYSIAAHLYAAATMYNYTQGTAAAATWGARTSGLLKACGTFFTNNVMYEQACEPENTCDTDQFSFKAYMSRWLAKSSIVAPALVSQQANTWLTASAQAAAAACAGGADGTMCGQKWTTGGFDNSTGPGQQLSALETFLSLLVDRAPALAVGGSNSSAASGSSKDTPASSTMSSSTLAHSSAAAATGSAASHSVSSSPAGASSKAGQATPTPSGLMTASGAPPPVGSSNPYGGAAASPSATQAQSSGLSQAAESAAAQSSALASFESAATVATRPSSIHALAMALVVVLSRWISM